MWELSVGERQGEAGLPGRLPPQALGLCARTCAVPLVWSPPPPVSSSAPHLPPLHPPLSPPGPSRPLLCLLRPPICLSPFSPISFSPSPPPPAFSTLPHPTLHHFVLAICLPFHRCPSSSEEEAVITEISRRRRRGLSWGEADRGAVLSMAALAGAGNKVAWGSQSWLQALVHLAGQGFKSCLLPIPADDFGQVIQLPLRQGNVTHHMRLFEESVR